MADYERSIQYPSAGWARRARIDRWGEQGRKVTQAQASHLCRAMEDPAFGWADPAMAEDIRMTLAAMARSIADRDSAVEWAVWVFARFPEDDRAGHRRFFRERMTEVNPQWSERLLHVVVDESVQKLLREQSDYLAELRASKEASELAMAAPLPISSPGTARERGAGKARL